MNDNTHDEVPRRSVLCGLAALALCSGCRDAPKTPVDSAPLDSAPLDSSTLDSVYTSTCDEVTPGSAEEGWVEVLLADYPELLEIGGQAAVSVDAALLHVIVVQVSDGCWIALWRVCPHGACDVEWENDVSELVCPCHGSRFEPSGELLEGPADRGLESYPVGRVGDSLWIYRPI